MKQIYPSFYPDFQCTASHCSDNCCIGWEIDIDPQTDAFYQSVQSNFSVRLQTQISRKDTPHFILDKDERCPFLNKQNLCDIFTNLGEEHLCEICTEHPRFHEWFGDYKESGLGLCCEEAVRLLLSSSEPLSFSGSIINEEADTAPFNKPLFDVMINLRQKIFTMLQNRSLPLFQRLQGLIFTADLVAEALEESEETENFAELNQILPSAPFYFSLDTSDCIEQLSQILHFLQTLEPIDPQWSARLSKLSQQLPDLILKKDEFLLLRQDFLYEYEHLCVYFLYRYLMKSVRDGNLFSYISLSVFAVLFLFLLGLEDFAKQGSFSLSDQIRNIKAFSKEIEYSNENLDALLEEFCFSDAFSPDSLIKLCHFLLS